MKRQVLAASFLSVLLVFSQFHNYAEAAYLTYQLTGNAFQTLDMPVSDTGLDYTDENTGRYYYEYEFTSPVDIGLNNPFPDDARLLVPSVGTQVCLFYSSKIGFVNLAYGYDSGVLKLSLGQKLAAGFTEQAAFLEYYYSSFGFMRDSSTDDYLFCAEFYSYAETKLADSEYSYAELLNWLGYAKKPTSDAAPSSSFGGFIPANVLGALGNILLGWLLGVDYDVYHSSFRLADGSWYVTCPFGQSLRVCYNPASPNVGIFVTPEYTYTFAFDKYTNPGRDDYPGELLDYTSSFGSSLANGFYYSGQLTLDNLVYLEAELFAGDDSLGYYLFSDICEAVAGFSYSQGRSLNEISELALSNGCEIIWPVTDCSYYYDSINVPEDGGSFPDARLNTAPGIMPYTNLNDDGELVRPLYLFNKETGIMYWVHDVDVVFKQQSSDLNFDVDSLIDSLQNGDVAIPYGGSPTNSGTSFSPTPSITPVIVVTSPDNVDYSNNNPPAADADWSGSQPPDTGGNNSDGGTIPGDGSGDEGNGGSGDGDGDSGGSGGSVGWQDRFPFSLVKDLTLIVSLFVAPPVAPVIDFPIAFGNSAHLDFAPFEPVAQVLRTCLSILALYGVVRLYMSVTGISASGGGGE